MPESKDIHLLRRQLQDLLESRSAHARFDDAVDRFPPRLRGKVPDGLPYSGWQLLEHLRLAQKDILEFCVDPDYRERRWPQDYWPKSPAPPSPAAWNRSLTAFRKDLEALKKMAADRKVDLFAKIPHGTGQTYLREILLAADHNAYHVGEMVVLRRLLGAWKAPKHP